MTQAIPLLAPWLEQTLTSGDDHRCLDDDSGVRPIAHTEANPGHTLAGRYRLECPLGEGGMGTVYRATHLVLEQAVAVKILRPELRQHSDIVERFLREARACAQLSGPHVVHVFDVGIENQVPFMVMELLRGCDLSSILQERGPLPFAQAIDFVQQACEALEEAHREGIVHRDIKPANLFLAEQGSTGEGLLKVLDFGVSKRRGDRPLTRFGQNLGSPHYMAPEQVRAPASVNASADIWSIGHVLFELITGRPAFDAPTVQEIWAKALNCAPPSMRTLRPDTPILLERVFDKCVRKDPAQRYQSAGEVMEALGLVMQLEGLSKQA